MKRIIFVISLLLVVSTVDLMSQEIQPMEISYKYKSLTDIWLYAAGNRMEYNYSVRTANNGYWNADEMYTDLMEIGINADLYTLKLRNLILRGGVGYKDQRYYYLRHQNTNYGVDTHWLTLDLSIIFSYLQAGLKSEILMNSKIKNNDNFTYEGLYKECFSPITCAWYIGGVLKFAKFEISMRMGGYINSQINPNKMSYYNMVNSYIDSLFFEYRFSFRIFTSGNKLLTVTMF